MSKKDKYMLNERCNYCDLRPHTLSFLASIYDVRTKWLKIFRKIQIIKFISVHKKTIHGKRKIILFSSVSPLKIHNYTQIFLQTLKIRGLYKSKKKGPKTLFKFKSKIILNIMKT